MATMLGECSPAYVTNCARTMKALMNHAVKRQLIPASPLTEKIRFEDVPLPDLEAGFIRLLMTKTTKWAVVPKHASTDSSHWQ